MTKRIIAVDSSYVGYAALWTTGGLSHADNPTGVIFGFMKKIEKLRDDFPAAVLIFCFDAKQSKREKVYPQYKANRSNRNKEVSQDELDARRNYHLQMDLLRDKILPACGFQVEYQEGYEADDLIASVCIHNKCEVIIVSGDEDLYQLLSPSIMIRNRNELLTEEWFRKTWQLPPSDWAKVKAIAGCSTDNVIGVKGVGEKTAAKWMRGLLKGKLADAIAGSWPLIKQNYRLVKLPLKGTQRVIARPCSFDASQWDSMAEKYGMQSLVRGVKKRNKKG